MDYQGVLIILGLLLAISKLIDVLMTPLEISNIKLQLTKWGVSLFDDVFSLQKTIDSYISSLNNIFENIYGKKHWSLKCVFRSFLSTTFAFFLIYLLLIILLADEDISFIEFLKEVDFVIFYVVIINIVLDYLSLYITRLCIKYAIGKHWAVVFLFIILDIVITTTIMLYPIKYFGISTLFVSLIISTYSKMGFFLFLTIPAMFLTTYFTSLMSVIMLVGGLFLRFFSVFRKPIIHLINRLISLNNPVSAIAAIFAVLIAIVKIIKDL